jgi:hypothetical protein
VLQHPLVSRVAGGRVLTHQLDLIIDEQTNAGDHLIGCEYFAVAVEEGAGPGTTPANSVKPSAATTCRACSGTHENAVQAKSSSRRRGPAMFQSMKPTSLPSFQTAL